MELVAILLLGVGVGAAYAIEAQGIVLIYRASRVVNFAQTGLAVVGAYVTYALTQAGSPVGLALVGGVLAAGITGVLIYLLVLKPLTHATDLVRLVAILGVLMVLQSLMQLIFGQNTQEPPNVLTGATWHLGTATIGANRIILLIIGAALAAVLAGVSRWTRFGLLTRAVAEDPLAFSGLGRSSDVVSMANWLLGGALAGLAGALLAPITGLSVSQLETLLLPAIAAALVGRFRSFLVTFVAAIGIGAASAVVTYYWPASGLSDSIPLFVVVAVLAVRGQGAIQRGELTGRMPEVGSGRTPTWALVLIIPAVWVTMVAAPAWADAIAVSAATAFIFLSVVIITGYAGQLSLAQLALGGVAALITGKLSGGAGLPFLLVLVIAAICVIPIGLLLGIPAFRSRGTNAAIATLALAFVVQQAILSNPSITGGYFGTTTVAPELFGFSVNPVLSPNRYAALTVVMLFLGLLVAAALRRGGVGRKWLAVRANERSAAALGVNVFATKVGAFCTAAVFAAIGGVLLAYGGPTVLFTGYNTDASINVVVLTVIGGVGFLGGALNGALLASGGLLAFVIAQYTSWSYQVVTLAAGVVVILNAILAPSGLIADISHRMRAMLPRRARKPAPFATRPGGSGAGAAPAGDFEATNISVRFGGLVALENVSLRVARGQVVGLIGPNGAGKTTLIDVLTGFTARNHPGICLDGHELGRLSPYQRARLGISRTFQSQELFDDMSLRDNLRVAAEVHGRRPGRRGAAVILRRHGAVAISGSCAYAIEAFGLEEYLDTRPADMPLAVRQMSGVARALASEPKFLLLDESAAGLDPPDRRHFGTLIREMAVKRNIGVLLVEHDVSLVMLTCDRVVALDFGEVIAEGPPRMVREDARVLQAYLGADVGGDGAQPSAAKEPVL
jgi:ABC-type branched-subunit amino acid transport system ATPase component/branched-subunit amino acid ABC-type transport system permease component